MRPMVNRKAIAGSISVYGVVHALVDAACVATLFASAALGGHGSQEVFSLVILYNALAFATQPLFGLWADRSGAAVRAAVSGVLLVAGATLLVRVPFLAAVLAGLGNALFHVGGGVVSLNLVPGRAALPGLYVAPGALGLMAGVLIGQGGHFVAWPFILLLAAAALLVTRLPRPETGPHHRLPRDLRWFEAVILLLLVSIAIRGVVGLSLVLPWKSDLALLVVLTCAVVLGKALGGILGDRLGWSRVALAGLAISAPLLAFFSHVPAVAIAGAFFFNLTMPITLTCLAEMLPGRSGFAFGLTTLALIVGAWPTFTPLRGYMGDPLFIFAVILLSIAALYGGLRLYVRYFRRSL